jgi:benzoylformate decarboxylase
VGDADVVLLAAGEFFEELWFADVSPFPEDAVLIQIDPSPRNMARNYPVHCGLIADARVTLRALHAELSARVDDRFRKTVAQRHEALVALKAEERKRQQEKAGSSREGAPMSSARLMAEVKEALPPQVAIVHEAITASFDLTRTIPFSSEMDFLAARGGGIGQGLPGGIGVKLALPERPVLCISGDGSSLYTIQALWTAAHHRIPVVFLILNNKVYKILKVNMTRFRSEFGLGGERAFPHMDLTDPDIDYVRVAGGFGMKGRRVESAPEVAPALREAFASGEPYLLEVLVDGSL